jgi:protein phosphatase
VDVCGRTDVGRTREHNEDAFIVADVSSGAPLPEEGVQRLDVAGRVLLFMVADGMGGAAAGEIASDMAVHTVLDVLAGRCGEADCSDPTVFAAALRAAAEEANRRIHACASEHPEYRGMGTTATIAGLLGDTLYLAQVGDSRAYILRDGRVLQITKDQSLLQRLVDAGEMTPEDAERSDRRNIILQALGPEATVLIDLTHQSLRRGDVLLLCSDGLSGLVRADEIERLAADAPSMCALCDRLVAAANDGGGPDNITVVAARFDGDGLGVARAGDAVGHRRFPDGAPTEEDWIAMPTRRITTSESPVARPAAHGGEPAGPASPMLASHMARGGRPSRSAAPPAAAREKGEAWVRALRALLVVTALAAGGVLLWRWLAP